MLIKCEKRYTDKIWLIFVLFFFDVRIYIIKNRYNPNNILNAIVCECLSEARVKIEYLMALCRVFNVSLHIGGIIAQK